MMEHVYKKDELVSRLETYLGKTFERIDDKGIFDHVLGLNFQKDIAGLIVEQCIFGYSPDIICN